MHKSGYIQQLIIDSWGRNSKK